MGQFGLSSDHWSKNSGDDMESRLKSRSPGEELPKLADADQDIRFAVGGHPFGGESRIRAARKPLDHPQIGGDLVDDIEAHGFPFSVLSLEFDGDDGGIDNFGMGSGKSVDSKDLVTKARRLEFVDHSLGNVTGLTARIIKDECRNAVGWSTMTGDLEGLGHKKGLPFLSFPRLSIFPLFCEGVRAEPFRFWILPSLRNFIGVQVPLRCDRDMGMGVWSSKPLSERLGIPARGTRVLGYRVIGTGSGVGSLRCLVFRTEQEVVIWAIAAAASVFASAVFRGMALAEATKTSALFFKSFDARLNRGIFSAMTRSMPLCMA